MRTPSLLILMVSLLFTGCPEGDPPIIPPPPVTQCEYPAGNRNYSWRLDTVAWFPSFLGGIHAFSDSDVYVMGYIGEGKSPWRIFAGRHWDGISWSEKLNGTNTEIGHTSNDVTGDHIFMVSVGYWGDPGIKSALGEFDNRTKKWKGHQFQQAGELRSVWTDGKGYFIAVGDNGMVYIKDGYSSSWVYQKAPTEFNLYRVHGVSKNEIYIKGDIAVPGAHFQQIWKYSNAQWKKLLDNQDTTNTPIQIPEAPGYLYDLSALRCDITDSLLLFVIGDESFIFKSKGQAIEYKKTNLTDLGLPLKQNGRTGLDVNSFTPSDVWVLGTRYNFYHWNGSNFAKVVIPGLPNNDTQFGDQRKMFKSGSGKLFLPTEVSSQVYVVVQGTPQ